MPLKYGTLLGLLLIVFGIVNITIGGIFYSQKNNLGFLLFPIVMIPAFIEFNKNPIKSKYLFWKALQYGVMISVIAAFLYSIFTLFYGFYYYDANKDLILATLRKKLESNEIPENEIIEELHNIKSHIIIGLIKIS